MQEGLADDVDTTVQENQEEHKGKRKVTLPSTDDIEKLRIFLDEKRIDYFKMLKENPNVHVWEEFARGYLDFSTNFQ